MMSAAERHSEFVARLAAERAGQVVIRHSFLLGVQRAEQHPAVMKTDEKDPVARRIIDSLGRSGATRKAGTHEPDSSTRGSLPALTPSEGAARG